AIKILKKSEELTRYVQIEGDVRHPGYVEWRNGLRVADLFKSVDSAFNSTADVNYAVVVREVNPQRDIEVFQLSLANAILSPGSQDNLQLQSRDRILVFNRFNNEDLDTLATQEAVSKAKTLEQAQEQAELEQQKEQEVMSSSVAVSHSADGMVINQNTTEQAKPAKIIFRGKEITEE
ncbi:OtnA protein, partial [Vibrio parahaemolyticus]|nr:OtnA protein [Vibrio parahaemolyticus]